MPRHDIVDTIRTVYWYETLRMRTGLSPAYALERKFEPEAFKEKNDERDAWHRNKWPAYRDGRRTPQARLVKQVDVLEPGTARLINHVLWDVMRVGTPVLDDIDDWIGRLEPRIQHLMFVLPMQAAGTGRVRRKVDQRLLNTLGRQPSLDALAALTILLREAAELGNPQLAFETVPQAFHILVAHAGTFPMAKVFREIFDIYCKSIFPLGSSKGEVYLLKNYPIDAVLEAIDGFIIRNQKRENVVFGWDELLRTRLNFLQGKYSLEVRIALMPRAVRKGDLKFS